MSEPTIGCVGLGAMGEPMVARLLDAGFRVVSNVNRSRNGANGGVWARKRWNDQRGLIVPPPSTLPGGLS